MMVEGTYGGTRSRVLCGPGVSGAFKENVVVTQGRVLSVVVYGCGATDKQKDLYKRHTPETIVRIMPGSSSGRVIKSPRTADRVERYVQQTWTESKFGEDGGTVGGT